MANIYLCTAGSYARLDGSRIKVLQEEKLIASIPFA